MDTSTVHEPVAAAVRVVPEKLHTLAPVSTESVFALAATVHHWGTLVAALVNALGSPACDATRVQGPLTTCGFPAQPHERKGKRS